MQKTIGMTLAVSWLAAGMTVGAQTLLTRRFDTDKPGAVPAGFMLASFRATTPGGWAVRGPAAQAALVHSAAPGATGYAMAIAGASSVQDLVASVRLRLAGGTRTGGLVWRYHDAQNFYALVLDILEGEMAMYRISSGDRVRLEFEDDLELDADAWHTLKVTHEGPDVSVSLGGIRVFEDSDRSNRTGGPGLVGVLATAASEVWFDDLRVDVRRPRR